jgi:hypothetical protein
VRDQALDLFEELLMLDVFDGEEVLRTLDRRPTSASPAPSPSRAGSDG